MKLMLTILSIAFILSIETAFAQVKTPIECNYPNVCYSVRQDKKCLEAFKINRDLNMLIDQQIQMQQACVYKSEELQEENKNKALKIKKKNKTIAKWIATNVGLIILVIIK